MKYKALGTFLVFAFSLAEAGSLKEAFEETSLSGFAFGRFTTNGGNDGGGSRFQFRIKADLTSGEVNGYSLGGGIFFSQGSGTPDKGNNTDNDIQGSRGVRTDMSGSDVFNISNLYINKSFTQTKTKVKVGQMNLTGPFTDKSVDRGIGGSIENSDIKGTQIFLSGYDSWITDDIYIAAQASKLPNDTGKKGSGIGNNLIIGGVSGGYALDDGAIHKLDFKLYDLWAHQLIDYMIFGELAYKYTLAEHTFLKFMGQVAATGVNPSARFESKSVFLNGYFANKVSQESFTTGPRQELATTRGLYNIQASIEVHKFYAELGFAGSFGQGYAALLDNVGGFNTAGKLWNGSQGHGADGFGFLGGGATKGTNINALYAEASYKLSDFVLGLDFAWVSGKNNYPMLTAGSNHANYVYRGWSPAYPSQKKTLDASFFELTPSIAYKIGKKITAQIYYASIFGDISLNRTRMQITYNF
ncbi:hypothetical protein BKH46_03220 [Helicobacter sp. 12S02634-8]|uniref:major outer membrane protein n=1 Tax=Helicobacter sp. 12S02634-8 TaxID=1476199 RepID=UPI000BA79A54|nr:major outer membrane protein [Helicobacter sp. 12S02634-8]PAF47854.1 hypothetical protein BKH46_03220 [Helicobacter sp. 12S02634-8]